MSDKARPAGKPPHPPHDFDPESRDQLHSILHAALSSMTDAVFISDENGRFVHFNDAFMTFQRAKTPEEVRRTLADYPDLIEVSFPDGTPAPVSMWAVSRALRGESGRNVEYRLRRKDTGEAWIGSFNFGPIRDEQGKIIGSVVVGHDITARKLADQQLVETQRSLQELSQRLQLATQSAKLGIWDWNIESNVSVWDDQMAELYGLEHGFSGNGYEIWERMLHPEDRDRAIAEVQAALRGEADYDTEYRILRPDGTVLFLRATGVNLRDPQGKPVRMLGMNGDISPRKRAEAALRQTLAEFEDKVRERTAALSEAREAAETANQVKDQFLATVSHELRTPLSSILTWVQLLERGLVPPEKLQSGLRNIRESAQVQNQLIGDLLDVSRIVSGKILLEKQTLEVRQVVLHIIDLIRPGAEKNGLRIETKLHSGTLQIHADPTRVKQILWNILSNAVKFTPAGGTIAVKLERVAADSETRARVTLSDTGKGVSPDYLPHLFDRFSQADSSSARLHGGLGLGLPLASMLVRLHDGTIEATSPGEGKGTTFVITFPLKEDGPEEQQRSKSDSHGEKKPGLLAGRRILLVEDDDRAREAFELSLVALGSEVRTVASVSEAMKTLMEFRPDLVISDLAMPGQDGFQLIRKLRALAPEDGGQTPAIALTAFVDSHTAREALALGFQSHLAKPVEFDRLIEAIVKHLDPAR